MIPSVSDECEKLSMNEYYIPPSSYVKLSFTGPPSTILNFKPKVSHSSKIPPTTELDREVGSASRGPGGRYVATFIIVLLAGCWRSVITFFSE